MPPRQGNPVAGTPIPRNARPASPGSFAVSRRQHRGLRRAVDAWVDAELDEDGAGAVAAHVRSCWGCSSAAETARLVKRSLGRLRQAQPLASVRLRRFARDLAGS